MGKKEFLQFNDVEIEKKEFQFQSAIPIGNVNIDKVVISEEFSSAK